MPSTVIKNFTYDEASATLTIVFTSGKVYKYLDVPHHIYQDMKQSFSKGIFFNTHIKDIYSFQKK